MKKMFAVLLSSLMLCSAAACGQPDETKSSVQSQATASSEAVSGVSAAEVSEDDPFAVESVAPAEEHDIVKSLDEILDKYKYEGVVYAVKGGEVIYSAARGKLEDGKDADIGIPMPVGSISKQFCAAAILLLQEKGKLSIDDKLDKYFPEYEYGNMITLKEMLSMRSGLPDITQEMIDSIPEDSTDEENTAAIEKQIFEMQLIDEPDTVFRYSNINFILLGNIVEKVSGEKYIDFLHKNFFDPLGMKHTGNIAEMKASAEWAGGVMYEKIDAQPGITKGAGDLLSTGEDINIWLKALSEGKVITEKSFKAMITDYSSGEGYGYGIRCPFFGGIGHPGSIGIYTSFDYINTDEDVVLFFTSGNLNSGNFTPFASSILNEIRM